MGKPAKPGSQSVPPGAAYGFKPGEAERYVEVRKTDRVTTPQSSYVHSARWTADAADEGSPGQSMMIITFKDSLDTPTFTAGYVGVTREMWRQFLRAGSKGKWVHSWLHGKWDYVTLPVEGG